MGNELFRVPQPDGVGRQDNICVLLRSAKSDFKDRLTSLLNKLHLY